MDPRDETKEQGEAGGMSNRERWLIYPLLIFAIALGIRSMNAPTEGTFRNLTAGHLRCEEVTLVNVTSGQPIAYWGPLPDEPGARIELFGANQRNVVRLAAENNGQTGLLEGTTLRIRNAADQRRIAEIAAGAEGLAEVTLFSRRDIDPQVVLRAGEQGAALRLVRGRETSDWPSETKPKEGEVQPPQPVPPEAESPPAESPPAERATDNPSEAIPMEAEPSEAARAPE